MRGETTGTRVWMLHRVVEDVPAAFGLPSCYRIRGTALTRAELASLVDGIGRTVPLESVERALVAGEAPPPGVVLTFDDGYREHLDVVAPLLAARGMTATFYVAAGLTGTGRRVAPVDAWYWLLDHAVEPVGEVPLATGGRFAGRVDTPEGKQEWVGGAPKAAFLEAGAAQQRQMLESLAASVGVAVPTELASVLYLQPSEWDDLRRSGMDVGAHSLTHPRLTQLDDVALQEEVVGSVERLRGPGGRVPFAYPDGAFDERVVEAVRGAGVSSSVTCEVGVVRQGSALLRLPREFVQPPDDRGGARRACA